MAAGERDQRQRQRLRATKLLASAAAARPVVRAALPRDPRGATRSAIPLAHAPCVDLLSSLTPAHANALGVSAAISGGPPTEATLPPRVRPESSLTIFLPLEGDGGDPNAAAESALAQRYPEVELVILDGSEQGVASELADRPGVLVLSAPGEGCGELIHRGLAVSEAELVGLLRPTDRLRPDAAEKLVAAFGEAPDTVVAHAWFQRLGEGRRKLGDVSPVAFDAPYAVRLHDFPIGPAVLVRRDALERIGGPDTNLHWAVEDDLWIRLAAVGPFASVHEVLAERGDPVLPLDPVDRERMARERVALVDKVFEAEEVPREYELIVDQAYRNAFVYAATLVGSGLNGPEERFYVADRLAIDPPDVASISEPDARLIERKARAARLQNELAWRTAAVNFLRAGIAEREFKIDELRNPPPPPPPPPPPSAFMRAAKRITPLPLQPVARRLKQRVQPQRRRDDG